MSLATAEQIIEEIYTHHESAIATFAQVLADCESPNFSVAQGAHEDVQAMRLNLGSYFDVFLTESTEYMTRQDLKPNSFEY